jgi:hypothetical protein
MPSLSNNILTVTEPTISLESFDIANVEEGEAYDKQFPKMSKFVGDQYPALRINRFDFDRQDVVDFELNLDGIVPYMKATVRDSKGTFTKGQYPADGDIVMLYIRSKDETLYKPIRMDFDITEVSSDAGTSEAYSGGGGDDPGGGGASAAITMTITGVLRLPGLYAETCKTYPEANSYDFFITLADELQLGFASNENSTDDLMKRLCPFDTKFKLMSDAIDSAYKDDNSFFTAYIDPYYYLTLVNVNKQITFDEKIEDTLMSFIQDPSIDRKVSSDTPVIQSEVKLYLTNHVQKRGSNLFIDKYRLINNAATVTLNDGYRRIIQYYDDVDKEYRTFTVEPLTTENLPPDQAPLKGKLTPDGERMYNEQQKYKYVGKQGKNVHRNYYYAQMLNYKNNVELEKMYLEVELETTNLSLYRFQLIPVIIYEQGVMQTSVQEQKEQLNQDRGEEMKDKKGEKGDVKNGNMEMKVNERLTGIYTIARIFISYDEAEGRMKQKMHLFRREWPNVP